jgi:5-methylcytosine-specific restriction enzyme subunit McrC
MEIFLEEVSRLVHKGIKKQYRGTSEEAKFQKGQLNVVKQIRKSPDKRHLFSIHYDLYSKNRPENRLLHLALYTISNWVTLPKNQRLSRELLLYFSDIPMSINPSVDLSQWSSQRDMVLYQTLKSWIELILKNESPIFSTGAYRGLSLLFPMQQLFEDYVSLLLRRQLNQGYHLVPQASSQYLVQHNKNSWFCLKPDMLINKSKQHIAVLDTKWKLLDGAANDTKTKYNISQNDLYQLFAYGEKYLNGKGHVFLIYPAHQYFKEPLPVFDFDENLKLWVVPFDLDNRCLVSGLWQENIMWLNDDRKSSLGNVVNQ